MTVGKSTQCIALLAAVVVCSITPLAPAPQEPGTEYVLVVDPNTSYVFLNVGGGGTITAQSSIDGWLTVFLSGGGPGNWDSTLVLGRAGFSNPEDLMLEIGPPFNLTAVIGHRDMDMFDLDVWYQDPNDWNIDPNRWPDPANAKDANDAPDPNDISPGDPNDPSYNDPNQTSYNRWADLTGGPGTSTGRLNSEPLYFWKFVIVPYGRDPNDPNYWVENDADIAWSDPFRYWDVSLSNEADPNYGVVHAEIEWEFWIDTDLILGTLYLEASGGIARHFDLTVKNSSAGSCDVSPDLFVNAPDRGMTAFLDGTVVTLTALPNSGKSVKYFEIYDPNYPGDKSHAFQDTNSVVTLTMDGDYKVDLTFKCGGSSAIMPLGLTLLVLVVGVMVRRFR